MNDTRYALPPGPRENAFVQAVRFGRSPYEYFAECAREIGDPFTLRLPGEPPRVVFSDPALVQQTWGLRAEDYQQASQAFPINIGENALLLLDGERHRRERTVMTPPLHGERLRGYASIMSETVKEAMATWKAGDVIEIHPFLQSVTLDVLLRCLFGSADAERLRGPTSEWMNATLTPTLFFASMVFGATRVRHWLDDLVTRSARPASSKVTKAALDLAFDKITLARGARAKGVLIAALREEIARCRVDDKGRTDILSLFASVRYEDGAPMDVDHIIDELVILILGGHETSANTLAWTFAHVLPRRSVVEKAQAEIASVFQGGPVAPSRTDELVYVEACIKEAMRVTPIAPAIPRSLARPLAFGRYHLPAGTILWPAVYLTHQREELWPEPREYRPERFTATPNPSKANFYPFGGGRRSCLGMAFATVEMRILLAEMLAKADLSLSPNANLQPTFRGITIAPPHGLTMTVERIRGSSN